MRLEAQASVLPVKTQISADSKKQSIRRVSL
jgi:hypothetical protein